MTLPSVVIQSYLTITAKRWGLSPTITFTNGASVVVTVAAGGTNISVSVVSGTSTMTDVKTAIEAHVATSGFSAGDLVTVAITAGHETDTVSTVVNDALAGGAVAAKASGVFGHLIYTAKSAGTAGNSTRVKYTSGSSLTVTVATADITVQLKNDGSSTNALIKALIEGDTGANALVDLASDGVALSYVPDVSAAPGFRALSGGAANAAASVVIQGVTVAANANGVAANGKTLSFSTGATAGAEVVTVTSGNINVQIQNGVSTVTQIRTALNAAGSFSGTYTATGTASTTPVTVNAAAMTGAVGPSPAGGSLGFYQDQAGLVLTTSYQYQSFGNTMGAMSVYNDEVSGTKTVIWSYDGINNHGSLLPTQSVQILDVNKGGIYLKEANGAPSYRVFAAAH